jgi:hypothetical protein
MVTWGSAGRALSSMVSVRLEDNTLRKKKTKFSLKYKEIQMGSGAKSYMRKGFQKYEEMRKVFPIYEEAVSHI